MVPWWTSETGNMVSQITLTAVKIVPNWLRHGTEHGTMNRVMQTGHMFVARNLALEGPR